MMEFREFTLMNLKMLEMVVSIKDNGIKKLESVMELESSFGQTGANMKVFGEMIELMAKVE